MKSLKNFITKIINESQEQSYKVIKDFEIEKTHENTSLTTTKAIIPKIYKFRKGDEIQYSVQSGSLGDLYSFKN